MASRKRKFKVFTQTSDLPYDRHTYRIHLKGGDSIDCPDWEMTRSLWFQSASLCSTIEVLDK